MKTNIKNNITEQFYKDIIEYVNCDGELLINLGDAYMWEEALTETVYCNYYDDFEKLSSFDKTRFISILQSKIDEIINKENNKSNLKKIAESLFKLFLDCKKDINLEKQESSKYEEQNKALQKKKNDLKASFSKDQIAKLKELYYLSL